jgi:hypothetical protein
MVCFFLNTMNMDPSMNEVASALLFLLVTSIMELDVLHLFV